jgi:hypothetical protein
MRVLWALSAEQDRADIVDFILENATGTSHEVK